MASPPFPSILGYMVFALHSTVCLATERGRHICTRSGRSWSCPSSHVQTQEPILSDWPGSSKMILEWAWQPPHQLLPQNLLTLRYLGEADWSWKTWLLVQAGTCVQGCDLVLWASASLSVNWGDWIQMQTGIFLPTNCGKPKAMPKISTNFQNGRNWGVTFSVSPLAWRFCTRSTQIGISESTPPSSANWPRLRTTTWKNHCNPSQLWQQGPDSCFIEFTAQKDLEKNLSQWPRLKTILLKRWENKKKTFQLVSNAKTKVAVSISHSRGAGNWSAQVVCRTWQRK